MTTMTVPVQADAGTLDYESALAELDKLIASLEQGNVPLAQQFALYERGTKLVQRCSELLDSTESQITELTVKGNGLMGEKPLSVEDVTGNDAFATTVADDNVPPINPDEIPF